MAIIRLGPIVQAASGTVGGVVFKNGVGGSILQARRNRTPSESIESLNQKRSFAAINNTWALKSEADRLPWEVAARQMNSTNRLGEKKRMTGRNLFFKNNGVWFRSDGAVLTTDPGNIRQAQMITIYTIFGGGLAELYLLWGDLNYHLNVVLYGARSYSDGGMSRRCYKFITRRVWSPSSCYRDIRKEWGAVFGRMGLYERFSLKMYIMMISSGTNLWTGPIIWDDRCNPYKPPPDPWPPT